jgi:hypothetical protein
LIHRLTRPRPRAKAQTGARSSDEDAGDENDEEREVALALAAVAEKEEQELEDQKRHEVAKPRAATRATPAASALRRARDAAEDEAKLAGAASVDEDVLDTFLQSALLSSAADAQPRTEAVEHGKLSDMKKRPVSSPARPEPESAPEVEESWIEKSAKAESQSKLKALEDEADDQEDMDELLDEELIDDAAEELDSPSRRERKEQHMARVRNIPRPLWDARDDKELMLIAARLRKEEDGADGGDDKKEDGNGKRSPNLSRSPREESGLEPFTGPQHLSALAQASAAEERAAEASQPPADVEVTVDVHDGGMPNVHVEHEHKLHGSPKLGAAQSSPRLAAAAGGAGAPPPMPTLPHVDLARFVNPDLALSPTLVPAAAPADPAAAPLPNARVSESLSSSSLARLADLTAEDEATGSPRLHDPLLGRAHPGKDEAVRLARKAAAAAAPAIRSPRLGAAGAGEGVAARAAASAAALTPDEQRLHDALAKSAVEAPMGASQLSASDVASFSRLGDEVEDADVDDEGEAGVHDSVTSMPSSSPPKERSPSASMHKQVKPRTPPRARSPPAAGSQASSLVVVSASAAASAVAAGAGAGAGAGASQPHAASASPSASSVWLSGSAQASVVPSGAGEAAPAAREPASAPVTTEELLKSVD